MAEFPNKTRWTKAGQEEDFQEEDVWGFTRKGRAKTDSKEQRTSNPRMIPRAAQYNRFQSHHRQQQHSAPINIPDWRKMLEWRNHGNLDGIIRTNADASVDDASGENDMLPPHEFISRRRARNSRIVSFSMCEGRGRTLKGRDLLTVRNMILAQTGFLE